MCADISGLSFESGETATGAGRPVVIPRGHVACCLLLRGDKRNTICLQGTSRLINLTHRSRDSVMAPLKERTLLGD
eukprot:3993821-Pyramimonas_sp.AAC.1